MKIAIFGTYPPPIGGTSVHVKRLVELLEKYFTVNMYDTYGKTKSNKDNVVQITNYKKFLLSYLFNGDEDIIHSHTHSWNERAALTLIAAIKRQKIIFTYHSFRYNYAELSKLTRHLIRFVFRIAYSHIVPNEDIKLELLKWGLKENKVKVIPTFLLPQDDKNEEFEDFLEFKAKHKYIISANASNNDFYNNEDLYGIDMCIELCSKLSSDYDLGFIFSITKITNQNYFRELKDRIDSLNLNDRFFFINRNMSLIPILKMSDLFIRPTNTDSFGISVGEALFFKTPAIASDVCQRPEGTILFKNRDMNSLYEKVSNTLDNLEDIKLRLKKNTVIDNAPEIIEFYKDIERNLNT